MNEAKKQMKDEVMEAYLFLRKNNETVPSYILDLMKDSALEAIENVGKGRLIGKKDVNGEPLRIGDTVEIYDWGKNTNREILLGVGTLQTENGAIQTNPYVIEDQYDFWRAPMKKVG